MLDVLEYLQCVIHQSIVYNIEILEKCKYPMVGVLFK